MGSGGKCMAPSRKHGQAALTLSQLTLGTRVSILGQTVGQSRLMPLGGPFKEILKQDIKTHKYVRLYFNEQLD